MEKLEILKQLRDYLNTLDLKSLGEYEELSKREQNKITNTLRALKA